MHPCKVLDMNFLQNLKHSPALRYADRAIAPGHSPAHLCFYSKEDKFIIGGDVLFRGSIGRTDLPGGNYNTLINSIRNNIFTLADDIVVYPGHGPETTIGYEKQHNPFF